MGYIYLIRNLVNGKGYVGQTSSSIEERFSEHVAASNRNCSNALYKAMRKYGIENFFISKVASCDSLLLNDLEKHYIRFYGTFAPTGHGYNLTLGGDGVLGYTMSDESKAKMSLAKKGKPMSEDGKRARKGNIPWNKGIKLSESHRMALSDAHKGKPPGNKGKRRSEESKARMSAAQKGHPAWNKGKCASNEARMRMSQAHMGKTPWNKGLSLLGRAS